MAELGRWLVVTAALWAVCGTATATELTLEQALELVVSRSRSLRTARAVTAEQEELLRAARAQRLPSLEVRQRLTRLDPNTVERANAAADGLSDLIGIDIPPFVYEQGYRTEAEARVPLWTGGELSAGIAGQRAAAAAATGDEAATLRQARTRVVAAFFAAVAAEEVIRARASAMERVEGRLRQSEHRLEVGLATRQEVLRWRVEVERARADQADAQARRLLSRLDLASQLDLRLAELYGVRAPDPDLVELLVGWAEHLEPETILVEARAGLERLPEVAAARARATAAQEDLRRARAGLMPRLDGAVSYGWLENDTLGLDEFADWSATVQLSVPVDARGDLRAQMGAARARSQGAETALDEVRATLELELGQALAEVLRTRTRLSSARRALHESDARQELLQRQHEVGLAGLLDLIDADTTLVASDVEAAVARAEFLAAVAHLELVWPDADPPHGGLIP